MFAVEAVSQGISMFHAEVICAARGGMRVSVRSFSKASEKMPPKKN